MTNKLGIESWYYRRFHRGYHVSIGSWETYRRSDWNSRGMGVSTEQGAWSLETQLGSLRHHHTWRSLKGHQMRIDRQSNNVFSSLFTANIINAGDKIAKSQGLLFLMSLHIRII
jgi:hypothetical protein